MKKGMPDHKAKLLGLGWALGWRTQEPLSKGGAGGGAREGPPRESDRSSSAPWTKASFFSAGGDAPRKHGMCSVCLSAALHRCWALGPRPVSQRCSWKPSSSLLYFQVSDLYPWGQVSRCRLRLELSFSWCVLVILCLGGQHQGKVWFPTLHFSFSSFLPLLTSSCGLVPNIL